MSESLYIMDILPDEYDYVIHITDTTQVSFIKEWLTTHEKEYKNAINEDFRTARYFNELFACLDRLSIGTGGSALRLKGAGTGTFGRYTRAKEDQIASYEHELRFLEFDESFFERPIKTDELVFKTQDLFD